MATYQELFDLYSDSALKNRITVAVVVAAETIMAEAPATDNHVNRLIWAAKTFNSPDSEATRMMMAVFAANSDATVAQIQGATDVALQGNVDDHIDLFATGS